MLCLPTVLLRHDTLDGSHHDWMLADPRDPAGALWTARVAPPSAHWHAAGAWLVEPIGAHRRAYLTLQGPVGGGRGRVTRVDEGWFTPRLWTASRCVIDVQLKRFRGAVLLERLSATHWRAARIAV